MKKNRLPIALLSLGYVLGLVSCGETPASSSLSSAAPLSSWESSSSSSAASSSSHSSAAPKIAIKNLEPDIGFGAKNAIDLDDYVVLENASDYEVSSASPTIRVSGHKVTGIDYGPFTLTVSSGGASATFSGHVVTNAKIAFDEAIYDFQCNYFYYSAFSGLGASGEGYYFVATESTDYYNIYSGGIEDPNTGIVYPFRVVSDPIYSWGEIPTFSSMVFDYGYAKSLSRKGLNGFCYDPAIFEEQLDENGDPTGYFVLEDQVLDEASGETLVGDLLDSLVGKDAAVLSYWKDYTSYAKLAANLKGGVLYFYPMDKNGNVITSISTDSGSLYAYIAMWDAPTGPLSEAELWKLSPSAPEQLERKTLENYFHALAEEECFNAHYYGKWSKVDTGEETVTPTGMTFDEDDAEILNVYDIDVHANASYGEVVYRSVDANATVISGSVPGKGTRDLYLANSQGRLYSSHYQEREDGSYAYSSPTRMGGLATGKPSAKVLPTLQDEVLEAASITNRVESSDPAKIVWTYAPTGPDMDMGDSAYYAGLGYYLLRQVPSTLGYSTYFYSHYAGWLENYMEITFTYYPEEGRLLFDMTLPYSSYVDYSTGIEIYGLGEDLVSAEAKAVKA